MTDQPPVCWVLSDGRRGIENQALGLAEAMEAGRDLEVQTYQLNASPVFAKFPPSLQLSMRGQVSDFGLPEARPDIVIGCGRQAIAPLLRIKAQWPGVFTTYVQDPRINTNRFDLVIAPEHDRITGPNVETMIGSPNRITKARIAGETIEFSDQLKALPMPRTAFLIGGHSQTHRLDMSSCEQHIEFAKNLEKAGHSLLISTSRRTPDFAKSAWQKFAENKDQIWLFEGSGPNPYFAFLGGADMILVTKDSTNMLTEACGTGKPVFTLPMAGDDGKFAMLYARLEMRCGMKPYAGQLSGEDYKALDETTRIARRVWDRFDAFNAA